MYSDGAALTQLAADDCLRLLTTVSVGRVLYTRRALPAVELVGFALNGGDIVVRTEAGGQLAAATQHAVVAFEADRLEADQGTGWSVTAVGHSREVTDPADIARLRRLGLRTWSAGATEHFIRITPEILTGRRLAAPGLRPAEAI